MAEPSTKEILKRQLEQYFTKVTPATVRKAIESGRLDNDLEIYQLASAYLTAVGGKNSGYQLAIEVTRTSGALDILPYYPYICSIWKRVITLDNNGHMVIPAEKENMWKEIFGRFRDCHYDGKQRVSLVGEDFYYKSSTYGGVWAGGETDAPYLIDKKFPNCSSHRLEPGRKRWVFMSLTLDGTVHFTAGHCEDLYVPAPIVLDNFVAIDK